MYSAQPLIHIVPAMASGQEEMLQLAPQAEPNKLLPVPAAVGGELDGSSGDETSTASVHQEEVERLRAEFCRTFQQTQGQPERKAAASAHVGDDAEDAPPAGQELTRTVSANQAQARRLRVSAKKLMRKHRFAAARDAIDEFLEPDSVKRVFDCALEKEDQSFVDLTDLDKEMIHLSELRESAVKKGQHMRPGCILWSEDEECCKFCCCNDGKVLMCNPDGPNCDSGKNGSCKGCSREGGCSPFHWLKYIFNRATWDFIALLVLIFVAITGPMRFGFDRGATIGFGNEFDLFVDIFFLVDIVLNFFTTFHRADGELERHFWLGPHRQADIQIRSEDVSRQNRTQDNTCTSCASKQTRTHESTCTRWTHSVFADYLFGWFVPDVFASLSFFIERFSDGDDGSGNTELMRILRLLRLAKLLRFTRIFSKLLSAVSFLDEKMVNNQTSLSNIVECVKALGVSLLFAHVLACVWHRAGEGGIVFGTHEEHTITWTRKLGWTTLLNDETSDLMVEAWMLELGIDDPTDPPVWDRYLTSLYWSVTTLSTVGYGDITPTTRGEQSVAMFTETLGTVLFCYLAGNIIAFVSTKRSSDLLREEKLEMVNEYLRVRNVHVDLKQRVRKHFEEYYERRTVMNEPELLEAMPDPLKRELLDVVYDDIVNSLEFLVAFDLDAAEDEAPESPETPEASPAKKKFRRAVKEVQRAVGGQEWSMKAEKHALCLAFQPLPRFDENKRIFEQGEHSTEMYAVLEGEVIGTNDRHPQRTFQKNESFGHWETLGISPASSEEGLGRTHTATAGSHGCRLMFITQQAFAELCTKYPLLRAVASLYCEDIGKHSTIHSLSSPEDVQIEWPPMKRSKLIRRLRTQLRGQYHLPWKAAPVTMGDLGSKIDEMHELMKSLSGRTSVGGAPTAPPEL